MGCAENQSKTRFFLVSSKQQLELISLAPEHFSEWDAFVAGQASTGSIYSSAAYLDILAKHTGGTFNIAALKNSGRLLGGVGLYITEKHHHEIVSNRLLLYYNGIVLLEELLKPSSNSSQLHCVLDGLITYIKACDYGAVTLHCRSSKIDYRPFLTNDWKGEPSYTFVVPLSDIDQLWKSLDKNARRLIRRAEEAGITAEEDNDFEALYSITRADTSGVTLFAIGK